MTAPLVSAIVVNWNGAADLEVCLPSLLEQSYPRLEIIVVDNGSVDGSQRVTDKYGATWLPLGRNVGLARAMNEGASAARGECLLFLNNDMRFAPDFVVELVRALDFWPDAFAADARQLSWDGNAVVHSRTVLRRVRGLGTVWGYEVVQEDVNEPAPCLFGSAANLLVRRELFEELGGWDPGFPIGWEDVDLCIRAWARGWPTVYTPRALCWHRVGASAGTDAGARARLAGALLGGLRFALIHLDWCGVGVALARSLVGTLRDLMVRPRTGWVRVKALAELFQSFPDALRRRHQMAAFGRPGTVVEKLLGLRRCH